MAGQTQRLSLIFNSNFFAATTKVRMLAVRLKLLLDWAQ